MTNQLFDKWPRLLMLGIFLSVGFSASGQTKPAEQAAAQHLPPMATDAHPAFEVATIKPSSPSEVGGNIRLGGHEVRLDNQSVVDLTAFAYSLHKKQIIGLPNWLNEAHFDIQGESNIIAIPNLTQVQEMLQKLLLERFGLVFHFGERELPVFAITVDKSGAKLHASDSHSTLPSETGLPSEAGTRSRKFTNCTLGRFRVRDAELFGSACG